MLRLSRIIATLFYVGHIPGMPGTYASVITALVLYMVCSTTGPIRPLLHLGLVCLVTAAGIMSSAKISRCTGIGTTQL